MRKLIIASTFALILTFILLWFTVFGGAKPTYTPRGEIKQNEVDDAFDLLNNSLLEKKHSYLDYLNSIQVNYQLTDEKAMLVNEHLETSQHYPGKFVTVERDMAGTYEVEVGASGYYYLELDYLILSESLNDVTLSIKVNDQYLFDEARVMSIPLRWKDETKEFVKDTYGDETLPSQVKVDEWSRLQLYNNQYHTVLPLLFEFEEGKNTIEIENISSEIIQMGDLNLIAPKSIPSYDEYFTSTTNKTNETIYVNAISYTEKNSSYIRMNNVKSPVLEPFHAVDKVLNVIDGQSWDKSGQSITYELTVPEDGNYKIALFYQNNKNDFDVFRTIRINGEIPFKEAMAYPFSVTKGNKWKLETLSNDKNQPFEFYLTKGTHKVTLTAEHEPVAKSVRDIQLILDHINKFTLDIIKITGKDIDKKRTWKLTEQIPETDQYLESYEILIKNIISKLVQYAPNNEASSTLSYLQKALHSLKKLRKNPDRLPVYLEDLSTGSGSVAQMLGDSINMLSLQPLSLDGLFISTNDSIKAPKANVFVRMSVGIRSFFSSFTSNKYSPKLDADVVDIWVNKPITYVDIMQKLVDSEFTPKTGIKVKISVMPDVNKLILASAAGKAPDVALGLPSYMPFDFAIRNAAYDLSTFDDFWEVAGDFAPGAFIPYILNDSVYALPETLDFNAIIYRVDTFNSLGLEVPDTWDDVIHILPELQRYGMNFYHPISGGTSLKWFYQTSPFIYQYGGKLYSEDGLTTTIDSPEASKGLAFLNSLFTTYSLPEQVASFYNSFRYNEIPIGIVGFGDYLQIKNAAPELIGQWALANNPGTKQADGTINRSFIANGTSGVVLSGTNRPDESWEFLKWWMSTPIQTNFAYTLQSTYGPEYVWLSGNIEAVKNSPIEKQDKDVILNQIEWLVDVPRTPGQYMLERGLSDIWNKAVFDGIATGVAIDKEVIGINRENRRKMTEFGFIDTYGNVMTPYIIRDVDWIKEQIEKSRK